MISADDVLFDLDSRVYNAVRPIRGERVALRCVQALDDCLYLNFKTHLMYVPTGYYGAAEERFRAIWDEFRGRNHVELSIKHRVSLQHVYGIVRRMRAIAIKERQADLFPLEPKSDARPLTLVVFHDYMPADLERAGLLSDQAKTLADELVDHLIATYPGISVCISAAINRKRQTGAGDLFENLA